MLPLTIHWSGYPAGCGMHQIVDAAHVCVKGAAGPKPVLATDLMYDVPIEKLAEALEPLVLHQPR